MRETLLIGYLVVYGLPSFVLYIIYLANLRKLSDSLFISNKFISYQLYVKTRMNWLGCLVTAIGIYLAIPWAGSVSLLCKTIYFLFHVGRKKGGACS